MFLNNWSDIEEMSRDFWPEPRVSSDHAQYRNELEGVKILLASYGTPSYEGHAFVLFEQEGQLFEVNASHCSCYGLEDRWDPEPTTIKELHHRVNEGNLGKGNYDSNPFADELMQVLESIVTLKEDDND